MKNKYTKVISAVLALLLCVVTVFANGATTKAETKYDTLLKTNGEATAEEPVEHEFTVNINKNVYMGIVATAPVETELGIYNSAGKLYGNKLSIAESDWLLEDNIYVYALPLANMKAGDYTLKLTFAEDTEYLVLIQADKQIATISTKSATVTEGFTKQLKVNNTKSKITWTSSKKTVATVDKKGKVTAKKAGATTITAKTADGQKLTCKITVKANEYKETKYSLSSVYYGKCGLQVYNASYAKNGDLVLKCRLLNNSGYRVNSLKDLKITFKTDANKSIGAYSTKTKSMSVAHGSTKNFTVTIKKSSLKVKNADLRNAHYTTAGKFQYYY